MPQATTLLKKGLQNSCFPVNFAKFSGTTFLQYESGRLFLIKKNILKITFALPCRLSSLRTRGFILENAKVMRRLES